MKPIHTILASLTAAGLAACGNAQLKDAPTETPMEMTVDEMAMPVPSETAGAGDNSGIGVNCGVKSGQWAEQNQATYVAPMGPAGRA